MITVTVKNNPAVVTQVKTPKTTVSSINYGGSGGAQSLSQLNDVDASDPDNNEVLVYDETENKYVVKVLPKIQGGTF